MEHKDIYEDDEIIREEISEILDSDGRVIETFNKKQKKDKTHIEINLDEQSGIKGILIKLGVGLLVTGVFIFVVLGMTFILIPALALISIGFSLNKIKNKFKKR